MRLPRAVLDVSAALTRQGVDLANLVGESCQGELLPQSFDGGVWNGDVVFGHLDCRDVLVGMRRVARMNRKAMAGWVVVGGVTPLYRGGSRVAMIDSASTSFRQPFVFFERMAFSRRIRDPNNFDTR